MSPVPSTTSLPGGRWPSGEATLEWSGCAVMGIVNVTPDSFSDGGRFLDVDRAHAHARGLFAEGALVVDVGGESTRPGAEAVSATEEWDRVAPVLERLLGEGDGVVSIDTRRVEVARRAINLGVHLVNDVSGLGDPAMVELCASTNTPAVIMHMRGTPATMQQDPVYHDVVSEVAAFLHARALTALEAGVPGVLVDPGIGFGKTLEHNLALLDAVDRLGDHGRWPVLIGASRKRFLGILHGIDDASDRDAVSAEVHRHVADQGCAMVRVHDVARHVAILTR